MRPETLTSPVSRGDSLRQKDRRNWVRVKHSLDLKFLTEDGTEHTGRTLNISCNGMLFRAGMPLSPGENLVCYIENLGRLSGHVLRSRHGVVAFRFNIPENKRDRLADQITWLINKERLGLDEERRSERHASSDAVQVQRTDGKIIQCHICDISLTGVALRTSAKRPLVGDKVKVGAKSGIVARYIKDGFAVDFYL